MLDLNLFGGGGGGVNEHNEKKNIFLQYSAFYKFHTW